MERRALWRGQRGSLRKWFCPWGPRFPWSRKGPRTAATPGATASLPQPGVSLTASISASRKHPAPRPNARACGELAVSALPGCPSLQAPLTQGLSWGACPALSPPCGRCLLAWEDGGPWSPHRSGSISVAVRRQALARLLCPHPPPHHLEKVAACWVLHCVGRPLWGPKTLRPATSWDLSFPSPCS